MKILAIDPGYERLGIAVLEKHKGDTKEVLLYSDCFKTSSKLPHPERLKLIGDEITRVISEYAPEKLAIETLFFSKNVSTGLPVAETRGVIIYQAISQGLAVHEFSPMDIKIAVTGYGKSDKQQIMAMVPKLVAITKKIKHDDEFDAIACGITFFAHHRSHALIHKMYPGAL